MCMEADSILLRMAPALTAGDRDATLPVPGFSLSPAISFSNFLGVKTAHIFLDLHKRKPVQVALLSGFITVALRYIKVKTHRILTVCARLIKASTRVC